MQLGVIDILSILQIFVSVLFAAYLFSEPSKNRTSNYLIALFLVIGALDAGSQFIAEFIYSSYPGLGMFLSLLVFFKIPLLYLYVLSIIYSDFRIKKSHLLHLAPFLLANIILIPRYFGVSLDEKIEFLKVGNAIYKQPEIGIIYLMLHVQMAGYLIACFVTIKRYKKLLHENYANASLISYRWLNQFLIIYTLYAFIAAMKNVFMFMQLELIYDYALALTSVCSLIFIIWIVLKALKSPELFRNIDSNLQLVKDVVVGHTDNKSSHEIQEKTQRLKTFMETEKPYLDPSISVYKLAKMLGMKSQELSIIINRNLNTHFFDFINSYRINEAKKLLKEPGNKDLTVLEILYEVGFNSKSTFNAAFKKHSGTTPTEYRKKHKIS